MTELLDGIRGAVKRLHRLGATIRNLSKEVSAPELPQSNGTLNEENYFLSLASAIIKHNFPKASITLSSQLAWSVWYRRQLIRRRLLDLQHNTESPSQGKSKEKEDLNAGFSSQAVIVGDSATGVEISQEHYLSPEEGAKLPFPKPPVTMNGKKPLCPWCGDHHTQDELSDSSWWRYVRYSMDRHVMTYSNSNSQAPRSYKPSALQLFLRGMQRPTSVV